MKMNITVQDKLGRITCPTLVIHGSEDFIVPAAPELVQRLIPNAELVVIAECGHYPFIEQPEEFTAALRRFIAGPLASIEGVRN
jgi:pimeloyl-ACP methyl ester carboxylesterase